MFRIIYRLFLCCICGHANAQSLCLTKSPATNEVDFSSGILSNYLNLNDYKVILFGEQHNGSFDPQIEYQLIVALNKGSGIRHVFMELGAARAWELNQFLQTGDSSYLYATPGRKYPRGSMLFWSRLFDYNNALPDSAKIMIHGVDFETTVVFRTLKRLSPAEKLPPPSLRAVMDTVGAHLSDPPLAMWDVIDNKFVLYDNSGFVRTLRYVQSQLLANIEDTKVYFGTNFPVVSDIIRNRGKVEVRARGRNKTMFAAMQRKIDEQHIEKFIGFFGNQHLDYSVGNSISNALKKLKGIEAKDMLNICEMAYDLNSNDTAFRIKHFDEIVAINGSCQATLLPAASVPGFRKRADFVVIANITE